jgi:hypothetical protein
MREQGGKCCPKCIHIRKENNKKWREYQKKQKRDNPLYNPGKSGW